MKRSPFPSSVERSDLLSGGACGNHASHAVSSKVINGSPGMRT